jgi:hypothetical protein
LGHEKNGALIPNGFSQRIPPKNYPARGLMHLFSEQGMSILNIYDISALAQQHNLPSAPVPTPPIGEGDLFWTLRYNPTVNWIALAIVVVVLIALVRLDADLFRLKEKGVDPDTLM